MTSKDIKNRIEILRKELNQANREYYIEESPSLSDFEYELQIAHTNKSLNKNIETVFLSTDTNFSFLSSSLVKEVAKFKGEIKHMVPPIVEKDLKIIYKT